MHGLRRAVGLVRSGVRGRGLCGPDLSQYDGAQLAMMEEMCILCDFEDRLVGQASKKEVHLIRGASMKPGGLPHRAFSVFLFDENLELLLQKRCTDKILFPDHWANTCCSHPLASGALFLGQPVHGEDNGPVGTIQAARRKLHQELGLPSEALPADRFRFVTKVHYKAPLPGPAPEWGEHEMDYILLAQRPRALIEASLKPNPGEVSAIRWVDQEECRRLVDQRPDGELISPWFGAIERALLHGWWDTLRAGGEVAPDGRIHRLEGGKEAMAEYERMAEG